MLNIELHNHEPDGEPPASFATDADAEIEIADELRRQIELRYLAPSAKFSPVQPHPSKSH